MELFNKVNIKEFETLKYIMNNAVDMHVTTKINIEIRSDKIDAPYYLDSKIAITHCTGTYNKGIIHAMDVLNHHRMYNITESTYNEIKELIDNSFKDVSDEDIQVEITDKYDTISIQTLSTKRLDEVLKQYHEVFDRIDELA